MIHRGQIERIPIADIVVRNDRWRRPGVQHIETMQKSLADNGLLVPVAVRMADEKVIDGIVRQGVRVLVHGATRLAAAKAEGWTEIDAQILEGSNVDFEKAEIAENLHRGELTKLDRDLQLARYIRLCAGEVSSHPETKRKAGRPSGGVNAAARELNIPKAAAHRAVTAESITAPAADAIRDLALANNPSAYRKIAAEPTPEAQVAKAEEIAEERTQRASASQPDGSDGDAALGARGDVRDACQPGAGVEDEKAGEGLLAAWAKANDAHRQAFLDEIGATLDEDAAESELDGGIYELEFAYCQNIVTGSLIPSNPAHSGPAVEKTSPPADPASASRADPARAETRDVFEPARVAPNITPLSLASDGSSDVTLIVAAMNAAMPDIPPHLRRDQPADVPATPKTKEGAVQAISAATGPSPEEQP